MVIRGRQSVRALEISSNRPTVALVATPALFAGWTALFRLEKECENGYWGWRTTTSRSAGMLVGVTERRG